MGIFDRFVEIIDNVKEAAEEALRVAQRVAEEARRKILEATEKAEQVARSVTDRIRNTADGMKHDLEKLVPSFDDKLEQIINEVTEVASTAAEEGVDITDAVNAAVEIALKKVGDALNAAIDAINRFLYEAQKKVFSFLEGILPETFHFLLKPVKDAAEWAVNGLKSFGDTLKSKISEALEKIKVGVQAFVRKVGEVLGPIWNFVKKLWKLLFGSEPEHCQLVAEWFGDRMKRTENELLYKKSAEPVGALIKKRMYLELLPPDEDAWKSHVDDFLAREDTASGWRAHRERMRHLLADTKPSPRKVAQITLDEPFTDELGGRQRVMISVLYFRWRTEEFRTISAGFLSISAMVGTVQMHGIRYEPPPVRVKHDEPLQIDSDAMKKIYNEIAPHMRLRPKIQQDSVDVGGSKKSQSRQLKFRDEDGVWRTVNVQ